jgi:hypothetical protein
MAPLDKKGKKLNVDFLEKKKKKKVKIVSKE